MQVDDTNANLIMSASWTEVDQVTWAAGHVVDRSPDRLTWTRGNPETGTGGCPYGDGGNDRSILGVMAERSRMRAADADRERVADILRDAHAEGRLTQDELLERVDATYSSRTFADLDRLITDLPVVRRPPSAVARRPPGTEPVPAVDVRRGFRRFVRGVLTTFWWLWAFAVALNTTIWIVLGVAEGSTPYPWPLWVAGPWGVMLIAAEIMFRRSEASSSRRSP